VSLVSLCEKFLPEVTERGMIVDVIISSHFRYVIVKKCRNAFAFAFTTFRNSVLDFGLSHPLLDYYIHRRGYYLSTIL